MIFTLPLMITQSIGEMEAAVKERTESFARCEREAADMKARRDQLQNDRKELWREENGISECVRETHEHHTMASDYTPHEWVGCAV